MFSYFARDAIRWFSYTTRCSMFKFIYLLCLVLIPNVSHATEQWSSESYAWGERDRMEASVWLRKKGEPASEQVVRALISHSKDGNQNFYVLAEFTGSNNMCDVNNTNDGIAKFNGQAIKMFAWCKKFNNSDGYYLQLAPETKRGKQFVINTFKSAKNTVLFEYEGLSVHIPAKGFTYAWNNAGGDAL